MIKTANIIPIIFLTFYNFFFTTYVHAASFDCTKARSTMEKAICTDASLSSLDEKLAFEYKTARSKLSPTADKILISSQRSWFRFIATYCFVDMNASVVSHQEATSCLIKSYNERIKDLSSTGKIIAGYKTYSAIDNHIRVSKPQEMVYVIERKYMQVDDESPIGIRLNHYLNFKDKADLPEERGTESYDIQLSQASPDWLYKKIFSEAFTGAYPTSDTECGVFSIEKERPLKISDVFTGNTWQKIFESTTQSHFLELAKIEKDFDISMVSDFRPSTAQPSASFSFCFTNKGIDVDGFLPHVARAFDGVTISWKSLENTLTPYALEQLKKMGGL